MESQVLSAQYGVTGSVSSVWSHRFCQWREPDFFQIRNLHTVRRYLTKDVCKMLVLVYIISRLDYGNSLLAGLPKCLLQRLQQVQNSTARLITCTTRMDHVTPILRELHWLPVQERVQYKVLLLTFNGLAPQYLADLLKTYVPQRQLRSSVKSMLVVPKTNTKTYGRRGFGRVAPGLWNGCPETLKNAQSVKFLKNF